MAKLIKPEKKINSCDCKSEPDKKLNLVSSGILADITNSKSPAPSPNGGLLFKPFFVQKGVGPHIGNLVFASDENGDTFQSNITIDSNGINISDTKSHRRFGINVRWNGEGFGYNDYTADNCGEFYELPIFGKQTVYNLNY
ncbi:MAG TPA: hypothetical protein PLW05_11405, partial [Candidatus Marinimicrobia bacterium]|nr:hypothetical protein [Candidatus Neomarinimicrobiota bacterium]HQH57138.1 hypothetical protein [Candidatus Neomarinimicrobiota bacterium]